MKNAMRRSAQRLLALLTAILVMLPAAASAEWLLPTREHEGKTYQARPASALTAILLIGYDHYDEGQIIEQKDSAHGGQSDFMLLILLDHEKQQIRRLQLDRDTITKVKVYGLYGGYVGTRKMQLCLAHAYGRYQEDNNKNTIWAVEELLGISGPDASDGAAIDWYMSMNISGIRRLNDALGGVTVPIDDDFSYYDETMVQGTTMRLTGKQADYYCRSRYHIGEGSNRSRMVRQRKYLTAASELLVKKIREDLNYSRWLLNEMGVIYVNDKTLDAGFGFSTSDDPGTPVNETSRGYLMTNTKLDTIVAEVARAINYEMLEIETLPGTHSIGSDGFVQFQVDEGAAYAWAMDAFYVPLP